MLLRLDELLARVLSVVDLEDTFVLVVADHGETLGERFHRLDHGAQLFDEQIRIPMILAGPGVPAVRSPTYISIVDIAPTLGALLGLPVDPSHSGRDRSEFSLEASSPEDDDEHNEALVWSAARADEGRYRDRGYELLTLHRIFSVRSSAGWKLIRYPGREGPIFELYDLRNDPGEHNDLLAAEGGSPATEHSAEKERYARRLEDWNPHLDRPIDTIEVSDELEEQLRALGYLD